MSTAVKSCMLNGGGAGMGWLTGYPWRTSTTTRKLGRFRFCVIDPHSIGDVFIVGLSSQRSNHFSGESYSATFQIRNWSAPSSRGVKGPSGHDADSLVQVRGTCTNQYKDAADMSWRLSTCRITFT